MADRLYFMIRDLYAIHTNVLRRQQEKTNLVASDQQQFHTELPMPKSQQQLQPQKQQQQREQMQQQQQQQQRQQHQQQQQQQQQLLQQDLQQFQLQQLTNLELPIAGGSNGLSDWTLPYYNTAISANVPEFDIIGEGRSDNDFSLNMFRLPEDYDQPLIFPSPSLPLNRDVDNNGV
jgi:hypothetical protein